MVTIYPDRGGISPAGTPTFASLSVVPASASAAMATLSVPSGSTLVSWVPQYRVSGEEDWESAATETDTVATITGLDPETEYEFRGHLVTLTSDTGTVTATTDEAPPTVPAYRVISAGLKDADNALNARPWGIVVTNKGSEPITTLRLTGRSTTSGHAQIQGAWIIGGTIDALNFQGTTWQRITFSGGNTFTPGNGSTSTPAFWASDRMTLSTPLASGESIAIRVQTGTGNVSGCLDFTSAARPNYDDIEFLGFGPEGDFGSDLAHVQTNPGSWMYGVNSFVVSIELGYEDENPRPMAAPWGDSVVLGFIQGVADRDAWQYACDQAMSLGRVVSHGMPGEHPISYGSACRAWLQSPAADLYETVLFNPCSWNNIYGSEEAISATIATMTAIAAAGKRGVLWICVPASTPVYPYGDETAWNETLAWARTSGYPLIETWQDVATGGVGPTIAAANTGDGVHLNVAGQLIQGASLAAEEEVLFT